MRRALTAFVIAAVLWPASPLGAVEPPAGAAVVERVRALEAIDGATLRLADGRTLRLAILVVPLPDLDRAGRRVEAAAERARQRLAALASGELGLLDAAPPPDRYRRVVAQAVGDGRWIQGEMVALGLARVGVDASTRHWAAPLLALEAQARASCTGFWGDGTFRVLSAAAPGRFDEGFAILEGRVELLETRAGVTQLRFGAERARSLTVSVVAGQRATFRAAGIEPPRLQGTVLRVRGTLRWFGGPVIEVSVPEQLERLR